MRFHLSSEFYCINSAAKRHENMMPIRVYFTHEQTAIGTRENKTLMVTKIIERYRANFEGFVKDKPEML